jgi:hypothetical protein
MTAPTPSSMSPKPPATILRIVKLEGCPNCRGAVGQVRSTVEAATQICVKTG